MKSESAMTPTNRRQTQRQNALNLLDYTALGADGEIAFRGLGRTLNVGENGLLLETHQPLTAGQTVRITIGLREDLVDLQGRVVRIEPDGAEKYQAGIEFASLDDDGRRIFGAYLAAFKETFLG
jgi:hypothetical protein